MGDQGAGGTKGDSVVHEGMSTCSTESVYFLNGRSPFCSRLLEVRHSFACSRLPMIECIPDD